MVDGISVNLPMGGDQRDGASGETSDAQKSRLSLNMALKSWDHGWLLRLYQLVMNNGVLMGF